MYEMEGALPGCVTLGHRLPGRPGVARHPPVPSTHAKCQFPSLPASRSRPRMVPVSNGENISTAFRTVMQESAAIHFEFFPVHTISTERSQLSSCYGGYPPAYAQLIHKLLNVIQRVLI